MSTMLEINGISKHFTSNPDVIQRLVGWVVGRDDRQVVRALDDVNLSVAPGEVMGLVGESGCGKSTLGRVISGILRPSGGEMRYLGRQTSQMSNAERKNMNLEVQMIFQNPMASLNPRMKVRDIIGEAPVVHGLIDAKDKTAYVVELLQQVGLDPSYAHRYPHQFSGGQRQRIGIARALALRPKMIVCDESVAALDVSIQAQVLNLFMDLRERLGLTYVFISHDLGVVGHLSDRVAVMYLGRIVEIGKTEDLYAAPLHPYTKALLMEIPRVEVRRRQYIPIKGEMPSPLHPPSGCHFHPRCPSAIERCKSERPEMRQAGDGRSVACHLA